MISVNVVYIWATTSFLELYSRVWCNVAHWKSTEVSGNITSIFRIEKEAKQLCFRPTSRWFLSWIIPLRKWSRYIPPKRRLTFSGVGLLGTCFTLVSCLAYLSAKMEAICSSETSVDFQLTTRRYIPEAGTLHNHRCENLSSYIFISSASMTDLLQRTIWSRYKSTDLQCEMCSVFTARRVRGLRAEETASTCWEWLRKYWIRSHGQLTCRGHPVTS
jgi:hypothetical protein